MASTIHYIQVFSSFPYHLPDLQEDLNASASVRKGIEEHERIYTYPGAINYLLNLFGTDNIIANDALESVLFKKIPSHTAVQFV